MDCVVLAAGYATRLYPLSEYTPKPLLPVCGKTVLDHLVDDLSQSDIIDRFVIVSNHKFISQFEKWAEEKEIPQKIVVLDDGSVSNDTRLGAVKDIEFAAKELDFDGDLMVVAGDNLLDFSLISFVDYFKAKNGSCIMRYFEENINKCRASGVITIDDNDKVTSMEEKPENPKSNYLAPPFYIYKGEDAAKIRTALTDGCGKDAPGSFAAYIAQKSTLYAMEMPGSRYDIGTVENYYNICDTYKGITK